ncbi:MAG: thioesterase family protein [Spirochaetaceae bacterium]|jgi:predicted thioesterase|nr:thioesterase family protein [Spirochaetaceae bacterium]
MGTKIELNPALTPGLHSEAAETVNERNTARSLGSGGLDVYATPAMIALMEKASALAVSPLLPENCSTVGTEIRVKHLAASPLGAKIRAESELTAVDGRKLSFTVQAWDDKELIGQGEHERFIIDNKKFMEKAEGKLLSRE